MDQLELLSKLPLPALMTLGITFGVMFFIRHFGIKGGLDAPRNNKPPTAEVAAVIVDPTALNNVTSAAKALTATLGDGQKHSHDHTHMICRRVEGLTDEIEKLTQAVNAMILEMARKR